MKLVLGTISNPHTGGLEIAVSLQLPIQHNLQLPAVFQDYLSPCNLRACHGSVALAINFFSL